MLWWKWCRQLLSFSVFRKPARRAGQSGGRPSWDLPTEEYLSPIDRRRLLGRSRQGSHW